MVATRRLGTSDIEITSIGLGCWQFSEGHGLVGGFWPALAPDVIDGIVRASLARGINWFDSAEAYGGGASERALARALTAAGKHDGDVVVATKWWPFLRFAGSIEHSIDTRRQCLDGFGIDLYQVHQPASFSSIKAQMRAMAHLVQQKRIRTVGVSNFNASQMRRAHSALRAHGLPLVSNQVQYNLLNRRIETNGVLDAAKELGITIIAYSPLAQGVLTGKFHREPESIKQRPGPRKWMPRFRSAGLAKTKPLVDALQQIAADHGVTAAQVALSWLVHFHGETVVAIPGATKVKHVEDNVGAMQLELSPTEMQRIDALSRLYL